LRRLELPHINDFEPTFKRLQIRPRIQASVLRIHGLEKQDELGWRESSPDDSTTSEQYPIGRQRFIDHRVHEG